MQEIVATGKTVDDAVQSACEQMGVSRDEVNVEVIELPKKKLFGSVPATVRVSRREDVFSVKDLLSGSDSGRKNEDKRAGETAFRRESARGNERGQLTAPAEARGRAGEFSQSPEPGRPQVRRQEEALPRAGRPERAQEAAVIPEDELSAPAAAALSYYKTMAHGMGADRLNYRVVKTERGVRFEVDGEDASLVIGRRGETMDSMQYLCMLVSGRTEGEYCKISVDVSGYRAKRERTLVSMARREASKVLKTGYDRVLEPMNPYERRIVHSAVQEIEGVKSESTGMEPHRRVVISLEGGGRRRPHGGYDDRRRGGSRPHAERPDGRPSRGAEATQAVDSRPADDSNADMLYKKIEL